jgi:hypothetical protein
VLDGHDLSPLLLGASERGPRDHVLVMGGGEARQRDGRVVPALAWADRAVRDARFVLIARGGAPAALFDLQGDPGEEHDLLASERADVAAARERLAAVIEAPVPRATARRATRRCRRVPGIAAGRHRRGPTSCC